jgi:hypothetical protein
MLGIPGASFSLADTIAALYGLILGPVVGPLSIVFGTILGYFGKPVIFLGFDFFPATVNALLLGLLIRKKILASIILYSSVFLFFFLNPFTVRFIPVSIISFDTMIYLPFHWMHFIALIFLFSPLSRKAISWVSNSSTTKLALGIGILAFIGTFAQHSAGSALWEIVYGLILRLINIDQFQIIWSAIFWIYPVERIFIVIISTIVGTALIKTLRVSGLMIDR